MKKILFVFFCLITLVSYSQMNLRSFINSNEFKSIEYSLKRYGQWVDDIHSNNIYIKEQNNSLEWSRIGKNEGGPSHTLYLYKDLIIIYVHDFGPGSGTTLIYNRKNNYINIYPFSVSDLSNNALAISKPGIGYDNSHHPTGRYWQTGVIDLSTLDIKWGEIKH